MFADWPDIEIASARLNQNAGNPLTPELLAWAEVAFVMARAHRDKSPSRFKAYMNRQRVICLDIPDDCDYMDTAVVRLLRSKVPRHLPVPSAG